MNDNFKEKNKLGKILGLFAILIIIATIAGVAWARYSSILFGNSSADVAKWSFNYRILDKTQTTEVENFAVTRTDDNKEVQDFTIAPGTSGEFIVEIDASRHRNVTNI